MKILVTGDVHNRFGELNKLIARRKPDLIICTGDFGVWPSFATNGVAEPLSKIKLQTANKLLFCDGNHEDHWFLRDRNSDELEPGIFYMPRGSTYTLPDGRVIMFMGGAYSIDKHLRKEGITWFPEETISQTDMMNLPNIKVDIFITHTCPSELVPLLRQSYPEKGHEPSNYALSELWKIYKPEYWYMGHWHTYKKGVIDSQTKWTCLSAIGFGDIWWSWLPEK